MTAVEPAVLSVKEAATYLGVSRATLYRITAEAGTGRSGLIAVPIRGRRVFRRVDLDAYLERQLAKVERRAQKGVRPAS